MELEQWSRCYLPIDRLQIQNFITLVVFDYCFYRWKSNACLLDLQGLCIMNRGMPHSDIYIHEKAF